MIPEHMKREIERAIHDAEHPAGMGPHTGMARISAATLRRLMALLQEWEAKAATWLASPEAAQRLDGYRELSQRANRAEAQRDALLEKINGVLAAQRSEGGGCGGFINKPPTKEHQRRVAQAWQELHEVIKAVEDGK